MPPVTSLSSLSNNQLNSISTAPQRLSGLGVDAVRLAFPTANQGNQFVNSPFNQPGRFNPAQTAFLIGALQTPSARGQFVDIGGGFRAFVPPTASESLRPLTQGLASAFQAQLTLAQREEDEIRRQQRQREEFAFREKLEIGREQRREDRETTREIRKRALDLGISTAGKSEDEIRQEVANLTAIERQEQQNIRQRQEQRAERAEERAETRELSLIESRQERIRLARERIENAKSDAIAKARSSGNTELAQRISATKSVGSQIALFNVEATKDPGLRADLSKLVAEERERLAIPEDKGLAQDEIAGLMLQAVAERAAQGGLSRTIIEEEQRVAEELEDFVRGERTPRDIQREIRESGFFRQNQGQQNSPVQGFIGN